MIQQNKDNGSQFAISSTEYQGSDTYNYIDALISMIEEMGTITLTTSVDGTIESYKIVVKSDMVSATLEILKDDKPVKTEEYKAFVKECKNLKTKLNSIKITEDSLPDVSETDYTKKRVVDSELGTVTVTYTCSYGSKLENESKSVNYSEIVYTFIFDKDGNFVKYIYNSESLSSGSNYSNSTYISSEFTYAPNMAMNVTYKCDDWVTITLFSESERYESVYYYSDDSSSGEVIEIFSASLFLELDLVNNKINIIEIFGNSRDCTYAEVVADRVRTDYGYLRHYVCSKCGNDYYTQLSNYLDDYVLESIVTCYNSLTNINTKYKLDELYVYNLEGFMYEYDSEIGNFVLTDDVDVKDTNDLGSYTSGYTFRYLPKQDVSE